MSDGCTLWLDGVGSISWRHCCDAHDAAYAALADKWQSDIELGMCVAQAGAPSMAALMFLAVTLFGWLWYFRLVRSPRP